MRVVSFQSKEVIDIILNVGVYICDINKCRENNDYHKDIEQLKSNPIWVFSNTNIGYNLLKNGEILERWRCEMSLDQKIGLSSFAMLELEIPEIDIKIGKTHNSYKYSSVISKITKDQLCAIHHIENTDHFFYKRIVLDKLYTNSKITKDYLDTREIKFYGIYKNAKSDNKVSRCLYCEANTNHILKDELFVCSEYCKEHILNMFKDNLKEFSNYSDENIIIILNKDIIKNLRFGRYDLVKNILNFKECIL